MTDQQKHDDENQNGEPPSDAELFEEIVQTLRDISERLAHINHGPAALIKRGLDAALRFAPPTAHR